MSVRASSDDDPEAFARILDDALRRSDLVITSGGISKGAYEVVREVLLPRGADVATVAMQPGGPQATAVVDGVPVFAFPGNPVSTQVSFAVFLRGPLRAAAGLPALRPRRSPLTQPVAVRPRPAAVPARTARRRRRRRPGLRALARTWSPRWPAPTC